jgi:hypothetical protein
MGSKKENGNGLPMEYCLMRQGLEDPTCSVFDLEINAGKKFINFQVEVRCRSRLQHFVGSNDIMSSGPGTTPPSAQLSQFLCLASQLQQA